MTRRGLFGLMMGAIFAFGLVGRRKRRRRQHDSHDRLARMQTRGQARLRAMLKAEGRDLDNISEGEIENYLAEYVDRVIHEYRAERREKERLSAEVPATTMASDSL